MMCRYYNLILVFILSISELYAEAYIRCSANNSLPNTDVQLTFNSDKELYISGETLWFQLFAIDWKGPELVAINAVVIVELLRSDDYVITRAKVLMKNGKVSGAIPLSSDLSSDDYRLRAYLPSYASTVNYISEAYTVIILNSDEPIVLSNLHVDSFSEDTLLRNGYFPSSFHIDLKTHSTDYRQRQKIKVAIQCQRHNGQPLPADIQVAVRLGDKKSKKERTDYSFELFSEKQIVDMEYDENSQSLQFRGVVTSVSPEDKIAGSIVYLSFTGKTARVYSTQVSEDGRFTFVLPKLYGLKSYVIQARHPLGKEVKIEVTEEFLIEPDKPRQLFTLPSNLLSLANASLANAQIGKSFEIFEAEPEYQRSTAFDEIPFYGIGDQVYLLDDYTRFPLPEFFYEVVPEVRVGGKFGAESVEISNEWGNEHEEIRPLLLVDGVPVFNQQDFLKINHRLISKAEIVSDPFWLNPEIYDGIIHIISKDEDARSIDLPGSALRGTYLAFLPERTYVTRDFNKNVDTSLPDFRNTLYWNPSIKIDSSGNGDFEFHTSDALGDYEVQVLGISKDGEFGTASSFITVSKNTK